MRTGPATILCLQRNLERPPGKNHRCLLVLCRVDHRETEEDLETLVEVLQQAGVEVYRPLET
jgi:hypothetical protein